MADLVVAADDPWVTSNNDSGNKMFLATKILAKPFFV